MKIEDIRRKLSKKYIGKNGIHGIGNDEKEIHVYHCQEIGVKIKKEIESEAKPFALRFKRSEIPSKK